MRLAGFFGAGRYSLTVVLSLCLAVCLSVRHTREPRLNGLTYRHAFYTLQSSDDYSFLRPDFLVVSLGVHPERVC